MNHLLYTIGSFFDRHRSDDSLLDENGLGVRGSIGGRGIGAGDIGSSEGGRPFGGGRGKNYYID